MCQGATKKQAAIRQPARLCDLSVSCNQMENKIPKALALATSPVRLLTSSLRANSNLPEWRKPQLLRSGCRLSATMYIEFAGKHPRS
jgi:hypothetical protein